MKQTDAACNAIIKSIAKKAGIDSDLIINRLLSEDDKEDMRNGDLPTEILELHVKVWIEKGMPDFAHGKTEPMLVDYEDF